MKQLTSPLPAKQGKQKDEQEIGDTTQNFIAYMAKNTKPSLM